MIQELYKEFSQLEQVEAIALGGSRAEQAYDQNSDYDVYVYLKSPIDETTRLNMLSKYCSYMEIGNQFWELEDDCVLKSGVDIELIYRSLEQFEQELNATVFQYNPKNAYTTCMWHNLLHSKILYDPNGRYASLQETYQIPYPQKLKKHIIERQLLLLEQAMPAFSNQVEKAIKRQDLLSMNHRTSEFFASYFDLLFALNEQTHPGEKRMLDYAKTNCTLLPKQFEENIRNYFQLLYQPQQANEAVIALQAILKQLKVILSSAE